MKFGELLRNKRKEINISLNELSKRADISPSYISKLENNIDKIPSFEILFKISEALGIYSSQSGVAKHGANYLDEFINTESFSLNDEEMNLLHKDFMRFHETGLKTLYSELQQKEQAKYENKVEYNRTTKSLTITEKPYFDIEWLLNQKRYSVFYGDSFIFNEVDNLPDDEMFLYKEITQEDKKVINAIIKAYFNSKYEKTNDPLKYYLENVSIYLEIAEEKEY